MIGTVDRQRFEREFRPGFAGAEICYLSSWDEAVASVEYLKERGLCFGIHFPLVRNRYDGVGVHPMIVDANEPRREHDLLIIGQALREAAELGADYLLVHYPKPAVLDTALDWSDWRFPQPGEALPSDQVDLTAYESIARATFVRLGELAATAGVRLVLEHDILHPLFYRSLLRELFAEQGRQPGLGLCIDTGRLHLQESTDPGFSGVALIEALRPWITNVHLWTARVGENRLGGHHPLLPELQKANGWGPMAEYLDALATVPEATVLFEHRSALVTPQQLDECYDWVRRRLQGPR
jgi:sugar phosphate isomerase/epimerase